MSGFFFHVTIELFPDLNQLSHEPEAAPSISHALRTLKPFLRSARSQNSRDNKFDLPKRSSLPRLHAPSTRLFERGIAEQVQPSLLSDHRIDRIYLECANMDQSTGIHEPGLGNKQAQDIEKGLGTPMSSVHTKGRYSPIQNGDDTEEWGIVHLYRDTAATLGLYKESLSHSYMDADIRRASNSTPVIRGTQPSPLHPAQDEDCTMLCILAVPSYLSPSEFLAFVGEKTRDQVSHFRMIRTSRQNRYMVLMKFQSGKRAREWQADWNGRVFNSVEPETVHVVFLKSVEIMSAARSSTERDGIGDFDANGTSTFPSIANDPFATSPVPPTAKPLAPRTSSLVELPTCPVCLERMDETTGLLTILCQHVFHCTCLQKWSGGGCPVCRYTHDDFSTRVNGSSHKQKAKSKADGVGNKYEMSDDPLECEVCHAETSLWQCLICGKVGCGRYQGKHAYKHFEETGHTFSMDLDSKRVWDYAGDVYVHRIIQDAARPGEKLVELPGRGREPTALEDVEEDTEFVKMENVALEYTHLLTSQLESQRVYFEEIVERAVDKSSEASRAAEQAIADYDSINLKLKQLSLERDEWFERKLPDIDAERARLEKRAAKFEEMAKSVNARYMEEKSLASSLMERIKHLEEVKFKALEEKIQDLEEDNATKDLLMEGLRDEHRDAMMQISAQNKLREMVANGELDPEDLLGATIEAGPSPVVKKGKGPLRKPANEPLSINTPLSHSHPNLDDLTTSLQTKLGLSSGQLEKGKAWDDDKASQLFDEFRTKMVEHGILAESSRIAGDHARAEDQVVDGQGSAENGQDLNASSGGTGKKKRKGKGKK